MKPIKITYKEVKLRQREFFRSYPTGNLYNIYRHFSNPFTYAFVRLGISPNTISIGYFFLCIIGSLFLAFGTYFYFFVGMFFFILFKILDDSDGEVARIQNSYSIEGVYLDRVGHYIFILCLGFGLGFGLYKLYNNEVYIALGFIFTFVLVLEHAIFDLLRSSLRQRLIEHVLNKNKISKDDVHEIDMTRMVNKGYVFSKQNLFSKIFSIYPVQGLLYSDHIPTAIFTILMVFDYFLSAFLNIHFVFYNFAFGLTAVYILVFSISKIIWVIGFIYKLEKSRYITKFLKE